jgi:hypothetical protein
LKNVGATDQSPLHLHSIPFSPDFLITRREVVATTEITSMRMRAVGMRVSCFFFLLAVLVQVPMIVSMTIDLCNRMATWIALSSGTMAVVMIVPV